MARYPVDIDMIDPDAEEPEDFDEGDDLIGHSEECQRLRLASPHLYRNADDDCPDANCPWAK